ncbi:MAG: hypothetical protein E7157_03390 [Lactobacillales bacterium]|nr:hypothetical protein [Lactobacillales bacterium]
MNEEKVKKIITKVFWKSFLVLLIGFTAIYVSEATGYYEFEQHNKKVLTEQKIKQFEEDVANGKNIDINDYVVNNKQNYETKLSKLGDKMSTSVKKIIVEGLNNTFDFLNNILS